MPTANDEEIDRDEEETEEEESEEETPKPSLVKPKTPKKKAGLGASTTGRKWESRDAEAQWAEMLRALPAGRTPHEIEIYVVRIEPGPSVPLGRPIAGGAVIGSPSRAGLGGESPSAALIRVVDDQYHTPLTHGPATYELRFVNRADGRLMGRATLNRPGPEEIMALRRAQSPRSPALPAPYAYGAPPMDPGYGASPYGFGAPPSAYYPPQQQAYADPAFAAMQAQIAQLTGHLQGMMEFVKRQGVQLPPQLAAPPPPAPMPVAPPPNVGVGGMPVHLPNQLGNQANYFRGLAEGIRELQGVRSQLNSLFGSELEETDEPGVGLAAPVPENPLGLPFQVIPIPEATIGGKPINFAINKETGNPDWMGIAMSNPAAAEKLMDALGTLAKAVSKSAGLNPENGAVAALDAPQIGVGTPPSNDGNNGGNWGGI